MYARRKRFGALKAVDVKRLHQLDQENPKLKKLVAEFGGESSEVLVGPGDSNSRPPDPQSGALTRLRYGPNRRER